MSLNSSSPTRPRLGFQLQASSSRRSLGSRQSTENVLLAAETIFADDIVEDNDDINSNVNWEVQSNRSSGEKSKTSGKSRFQKLVLIQRSFRRKGRRAAQELKSKFVQSKRFRDLVQQAFQNCDLDGSNKIEKGELWACVLWLYIELNKIPWGGRKTPPRKQKVMELMQQVDTNDDGALDFEEFFAFAQILCQDVVVNEGTKMFLVMFLCPMLSAPIRELMIVVFGFLIPVLATLLNNIPEQLFTSVVTAAFIAGIPIIENWLEIDSDTWSLSLSELWTKLIANVPPSFKEAFVKLTGTKGKHR